jgi:hypothetical protein
MDPEDGAWVQSVTKQYRKQRGCRGDGSPPIRPPMMMTSVVPVLIPTSHPSYSFRDSDQTAQYGQP